MRSFEKNQMRKHHQTKGGSRPEVLPLWRGNIAGNLPKLLWLASHSCVACRPFSFLATYSGIEALYGMVDEAVASRGGIGVCEFRFAFVVGYG